MSERPVAPAETDSLAAAAEATRGWLQAQQQLLQEAVALQASWLRYWLDCQQQWAQLPATNLPAWMVWHNGTEQLA